MEKNEKIAKQLLKIAKMMVADEENYLGDKFIKSYTYTDANPDFKTEIVKRGDDLSFSVVLTPSFKLDVNVSFFIDSPDNVDAIVKTQWNIEYYVYKNGGFKPDTTQKETDVEANSIDDLSEKVTQIVAGYTNGLKVIK